MAHEHPRLVRDSALNPATLDTRQRARLTAELYAVHRKIFDGVDAESFRRYVVEPEGAQTRIQIFRDTRGGAVGYIAIHAFVRTVDDVESLVVRSEVGVLRQYRGSAPQARFVLQQCLRLWCAHIGKPKYVFACPVHPASYFGVTRRASTSWPRAATPTPARVAQTMEQLADDFGLARVKGRSALVRRVGWITREHPNDRAYWAQHPAADVQFFRAENPGYPRGEGLLMLVPLSLQLLVTATLARAKVAALCASRRSTSRTSRAQPRACARHACAHPGDHDAAS